MYWTERILLVLVAVCKVFATVGENVKVSKGQIKNSETKGSISVTIENELITFNLKISDKNQQEKLHTLYYT